MTRCRNCGRDISHRVTPGSGAPPRYCDEVEVPDCRYTREIVRKRKSDHKKIVRNHTLLGRVPHGHRVFPGGRPVPTENDIGVDWDYFHVESDPEIDLAREQYRDDVIEIGNDEVVVVHRAQANLDAAADALLGAPRIVQTHKSDVELEVVSFDELASDDEQLGMAA